MKPRSERLKVVLDLEQRKEDEALDVMNKARQQLQHHQQQLDSLRQYQADYRNQMRQGQQGVVSVSRLQGWQAFIAQLDQAILAEEKQAQRAAVSFEKAREAWRAAYERKQGMVRHIEACRAQEQRDQDKREQKALDEAANRIHARRRLN
ncbi:flagellar export protein FliJ [Marinobacter nanhaiticus D15-8W]|uniref:Flagellar FliJ protein n=1 Tax=Marinobacter nanhaiticus D15-8W TaxID=626887 RepID=N6W3A3_9GAMM|nr:flagellar export protein FliJ [Marinobacter nanhaiticus]ENO17030.1 flagellar export protein FliJ [Marinobacter nanhaiticus D15-8W]BES71974.1 flagellar export protein FliJ [Marinobacter nanhaiticus D15-8W]